MAPDRSFRRIATNADGACPEPAHSRGFSVQYRAMRTTRIDGRAAHVREQDRVVGEEVLAGWTRRLRTVVPNGAAILLKGSHARGEAGRYSVGDMDVVVDRGPFGDYRAWIET